MARDEKGRFLKGETGNPAGRQPKERERRFYEITLATVTFEDWREIVVRAVTDAKRGDATARKWLSDYLVGVPEQRVDVTSNGETVKTVFDYSAAIAAIAPGPTGDSAASGEGQSDRHGPQVGQNLHGRHVGSDRG